MKIFIINPPEGEKYVVRDYECNAYAKANFVIPQIGLAYVAAMLENEHDVKIIDCAAENLSHIKLRKLFENNKPDICIINTAIPSIKSDLTVSDYLKDIDKEICTIYMGPAATTLTETVANYQNVDFVMVSEPEYTILELINYLDGSVDNLADIKGIAFSENNKIILTEIRPLIENLDDLPFPAHHLLPLDKCFLPTVKRRPFTSILSSRGCPYQCIYCYMPRMGKKFRSRSANNVIDEVELVVKKMGIKQIMFRDDVFTLDKKRVIDICKEIIARDIDIIWHCESRPDNINFEVLKIMKSAGCHLIIFGVETADEKILENIKKNLSIDKINQAFRWCDEVGIDTGAHFIFGLPGETKETIEKTIEYAKKLEARYASFNVATPYPGTEFFDWLKERGLIKTTDWSLYDQSGYPVFDLPTLSAEGIWNGFQHAYKEYYNISYVVREMMKIRSFDELKKDVRAGINLFTKTLKNKK